VIIEHFRTTSAGEATPSTTTVAESRSVLTAAKLVKVRDAGHLQWLERPTEVRAACLTRFFHSLNAAAAR
jgi:pimeloyl-ACP methyl ester carboxylesterase